MNWKQFSFWNADQWPRDGATNLYGSHPFYINMNPETGKVLIYKSRGVLSLAVQNTIFTFRPVKFMFSKKATKIDQIFSVI